jgi:transcriptional regulator with XRE-family HTH domain
MRPAGGRLQKVADFKNITTLGQLLVRRRKELGIKQKEMAAMIRNRDGKPLLATYLNYLEYDRGKPPDYLIDQMAELLKMPHDVLYFYVRRLPNDIGPKDSVDQERIVAAYEALRGELNGSKPDSL